MVYDEPARSGDKGLDSDELFHAFETGRWCHMIGRFSRRHIMVGIFLSGSGISLIGNVMAMVALPWFVLQTTGSAAQTGLTGMAAVLPAFLSGIFGGAIG